MTDEPLPEFLSLVLDAMGVRAPPPKQPRPTVERQFEGHYFKPGEEVPF